MTKTSRLAAVLVVLLVSTGCVPWLERAVFDHRPTVDSLKPGVPRGTDGRGYMKTSTGYAIKASRRTYDEAWQASDEAISALLDVIDRDKARGVSRAEKGSSSSRVWSGASQGEYVGVFIR